MTAPSLGLSLYNHYQRRDWAAARLLLAANASVAMPATSEVLYGGDGVIAFQAAYPEPWGDLSVLRVVGDDVTAVLEIEVRALNALYRCSAWWTCRDGLLQEGVEYWVTVGGELAPSRPLAQPIGPTP